MTLNETRLQQARRRCKTPGGNPSGADFLICMLADENDRLKQLLACAYQLAGTVGAPVRFLDAFSRYEGDIDSLLPVSLDECDEFVKRAVEKS